MKPIIILFLLFICSVSLFAQGTYSIRGAVSDSMAQSKLANTTIVVLNAKDSTLRKFTRAAADGTFAIENLAKGKFILLVSYPKYADYVENFTLDSVKSSYNFGHIHMNLKTRILQEVIIKGTAVAIKVKGDTTEYNAAAYKIQPNAKVEDLLKQLPGMTVDKDGKITAQGETVNKVLVDGEEFFGDDPTLVTKNIRADMVDKVQLYDKKSDQAAFTGIDDGKTTKTINIKLKEDKKNGYFGKASAAVGTDGYYEEQLLYNIFKAKKKLSVYGTLGNDGKTGLGWEDNQKYGSSDNVEAGDDGMIFINGGGDDDLDSFDGHYYGQGIPTARTAGLHYDEKWNSDKESINLNYKIGSLGVDGTNSTISQNNLASGPIYSANSQKTHNYMFRNKLDLTYQVKLDSSSNLKIMVDGTSKHSETQSTTTSDSRSLNDTLLNKNYKTLDNKVDGKIFNANALYTKKFKKKGRTFSLNVREAYDQSEAKGKLYSNASFYNKQGAVDSTQLVDQYKTNNIKSSVFNTNMTYSEPLSKTFSVLLNYGIGIDNSSADRRSFNQSAPGVYNVLDSTFSNNFKLKQFSNQGGAIFNFKKGKNILNFGTRLTSVNFKQINEYTGNVFTRNFLNWSPQASYQYKFSQQSSFRFNYNGSTTQPSVDQIQPVLVNTDPLNVVIGNPGLTPSFTHNFNLSYNSFKVLSEQYFFVNGGFSFTTNPISSSITTDTTSGKTISQYINIGNKTPYNFYLNGVLDRKIKGPDFNIGLELGANGNKNYSISNGALNASDLTTYSIRARIQKYVPKKYDFYLSAGPNFSYGGSSLNRSVNNNGHGVNGNAGFNIYLPGKFKIGSNADYQYNSATQTFSQDFSKVILNSYIAKTFFKGDNLQLAINGNDLLNQNAGFSRSVNGNLITQNTYTTIKRFFLLSLTYDFSKMGAGSAKK